MNIICTQEKWGEQPEGIKTMVHAGFAGIKSLVHLQMRNEWMKATVCQEIP